MEISFLPQSVTEQWILAQSTDEVIHNILVVILIICFNKFILYFIIVGSYF
jgi:hypothetical protein